MTKKILTIEDVAEVINEDLPADKAEINTAWLRNLHSTLKDGGEWAWPEGFRIYRKSGDGFVLTADFLDPEGPRP